uniref:Secreted protein n=1 Tax=Quercus lobata TaxID=97700 RepID=A0A7N2LD48_QUELO
MVLQLFFTLAFSAVPLTLYVPPVRSLNLFLEAVEGFLRESRIYTNRVYPRVRVVWSRLVDCMLCSNMSLCKSDRIEVSNMHNTVVHCAKSRSIATEKGSM